MDPRLLIALFMGWALGSNDAANIFGSAVASFMVRYRTAVVLTAVFVMIGALAHGGAGMETLSALADQTRHTALAATLAAALTVTLMTILRLPVSTSQAVVGAIVGVGLLGGGVDTGELVKVVACWVGTPLGAGLCAVIIQRFGAPLLRRFGIHFLAWDRLMRFLLIAGGVYGAYALGANNVANVTGVFYRSGIIGLDSALWIGGAGIGLGALTYSRRVMITVGRGIMPVDAFSAFTVVLAHSLTLHFYAVLGVPVSSSQAVVGAVVGLGLLKGGRVINRGMVLRILSGWLVTPLVGMAACMLILALSGAR